jgi:hypothetical protein
MLGMVATVAREGSCRISRQQQRSRKPQDAFCGRGGYLGAYPGRAEALWASNGPAFPGTVRETRPRLAGNANDFKVTPRSV